MGVVLDRTEHVYLRILRAAILVIATMMIAYAAWLAFSSVYKLSRSPDSVVEQVATVNADELTDAELPVDEPTETTDAKPTASTEQRRFYASFVAAYYDLFRKKFEPFRQAEDKQLSRDEFDDSFIGSQARLASIAEGKLDYETDRDDLSNLLSVMTEAADKPATNARLQKYRAAKKVRVAKQVQKSRTEYRRGWDSYSTACEDWYYSPIGCAVRRRVEVPYTETAYAMEFPKGTQSHTQIFKAFQNRYFDLLHGRRDENARTAEEQRESIIAGKLEGGINLWTALQIAGAFLALMFFFLLIAIERHQRLIAANVDNRVLPLEAVEQVD